MKRTAAQVSIEVRVELIRIGWTQAELAGTIRMSQSAFNRRMTGQTAWDLDDVDALGLALGEEFRNRLTRLGVPAPG